MHSSSVPTSSSAAPFWKNYSQRNLANFLLAGSGIAGLCEAYASRQMMGVDGVSYLDIASAYLRHDWQLAVNAYWSPLYSWLLAAFLGLIPHSYKTEFPVFHVVNFFCYLFALFGFHKFWSADGAELRNFGSDHSSSLSQEFPDTWQIFGYSLFVYLFVPLISTATPDLLSSGFIFLGAQQAKRWSQTPDRTARDGIRLALILAIGYLAKAILLYFGLFVIIALLLRSRGGKSKPVIVAGILFLLVAISWGLVLRSWYGQFTFGSSGRLNYIWFVNGTEAGELLDPNGTYIPYYPGPRLSVSPAAFATKTMPNVTYRPWFDPVRFAQPKQMQFDLKRQIKVVVKNLVWLRSWFLVEFGPVTLCLLTVLIAAGWRGTKSVFEKWTVWAPVLLVIGMYALVFVRSYRYIAAFTIVLFGLGIGSPLIPRSKVMTLRAALSATVLLFAVINFPGTIKGLLRNAEQSGVHVKVAEALHATGIEPGDVVGVVGTEDYISWARLAEVSVGAEVWPKDLSKFWQLDESQRDRIICEMKQHGAKVVVVRTPEGIRPDGWIELGRTGHFLAVPAVASCVSSR